MPYECPNCHESEFEKRGDRRVYFKLDDDLKEDGWSEGEITIDTLDSGDDTIYCVGCEEEWREGDLIETV